MFGWLLVLCGEKREISRHQTSPVKLSAFTSFERRLQWMSYFPSMAIFNPAKKFDWDRFWSHARQPLLSRERVSRNQQNNAVIVIFAKLHLNTWLPLSLKLTFSSQNHYHSAVFLQNSAALVWFQERNSNDIAENTANRSMAFLCNLAHFNWLLWQKQDKIRCLF